MLTCRLINYLIAADNLWQQKQILEVRAGTCQEVLGEAWDTLSHCHL